MTLMRVLGAAMATLQNLDALEKCGLIEIEDGEAGFPSDRDPGDEQIDDSIPVADRGNAELLRFEQLVRSGEPVPVDLSTALAAQGFDVDALEVLYSL